MAAARLASRWGFTVRRVSAVRTGQRVRTELSVARPRPPDDLHPAAGGRATKVGRKPYWGTARPEAWLMLPPNGTPGIPAATAGGGATIGVPPSAADSGLC